MFETNRALLRKLADDVDPPATSVEEWEAAELARIRFTMYMAITAESIPRRLGKGATGTQLALDKRIARKVANMYRQLWLSLEQPGDSAPHWTGRDSRLALVRDAEPAMRMAGATVTWSTWLKQRKADAKERRVEVAALAMRHGLVRWGSRRVGLLTLEVNNIERIAAEAVERIRRAA